MWMQVFFWVDLLAGTVYIHLENFDDYHISKPKIEVWKEEKCNRFKDDGSFMTSFEDQGTIERIQQLLENLDQRG